MPQYRLQFVREDDEHVVYTEHPDRIHPRELSTWLQGKYGKSNVDIYLLKNIYVIYINRNAVSPGEIGSLPTTDTSNTHSKPEDSTTSDWRQRLADVKDAQAILEKHRLSRS
ncbi:hypothetical protein F5X97DRAFT_342540 [Nemania serpens]|nr:hypothetical protein F5X97DRAFT_342540 [Nemania serpens]